MTNYTINSDSSVLITGGTGSFGKHFIKNLLANFPKIRRVVVFSRDELKQSEMQEDLNSDIHPGIRFIIGDIRDRGSLETALSGIDIVVHAAALKQVPAAEYNPFEFIKTNILGSQNLIEASIKNNVKKVIALSTDKAVSPVNLYGATKLCADKLFIAANNIVGAKNTIFSVVRYGNVMGSRGSVIPYFMEKISSNCLPITDPNMTRFTITLDESIDMVLWAIRNSLGGEIIVPKIPSYKITNIAEAICPGSEIQIIGSRPGEKVHEELIASSDSLNTLDLGDYYVIIPPSKPKLTEYYKKYAQAKPVDSGFCYNSGNNKNFLTVEELRKLIKTHIDPTFL